VYKVIWLRAALRNVTAVLDRTSDHEAVFHAMDEVDRELSRNPQVCGESRERNDRRIYFVGPLVVTFRIDEHRKVVLISRVGLAKRG
jgi:hypothetical protein